MPVEDMGNGKASSSKGATKGRGRTNNAARLEAFGKPSSPHYAADWGGCDPRWVAAIVTLVTSIGGAAMFGRSRDGGAYLLVLYLDGDKRSLWFNGDCDLDAELEGVYAVLETLR